MDAFPRSLLAIANKLLSELRAIREEILSLRNTLHEQAEGDRKSSDTSAREEPAQPTARTFLDFVQAVQSENRQSHGKQEKYQRCTLYATWAGVVVVAVYTAFTALQWNTAKNALVTVQRAFLSLNSFDAKVNTEPSDSSQMSGVTFYPFWKNSGTTPAINARDWDNAIARRSKLPEDFAFPDHDPVSGKDNPAGTGDPKHHILYYPPQTVTGAHSQWFNRNQIAEFQADRLHLYMYGWTKYHDIFKDTPEHVTMFCYEVTHIAVIPPTPSTPPPANLLVSMEECDHHNCVDETCKGEPGY